MVSRKASAAACIAAARTGKHVESRPKGGDERKPRRAGEAEEEVDRAGGDASRRAAAAIGARRRRARTLLADEIEDGARDDGEEDGKGDGLGLGGVAVGAHHGDLETLGLLATARHPRAAGRHALLAAAILAQLAVGKVQLARPLRRLAVVVDGDGTVDERQGALQGGLAVRGEAEVGPSSRGRGRE